MACPPRWDCASTRITDDPASRAMIAAGTPVAPAPITTTSASECHAIIVPRLLAHGAPHQHCVLKQDLAKVKSAIGLGYHNPRARQDRAFRPYGHRKCHIGDPRPSDCETAKDHAWTGYGRAVWACDPARHPALSHECHRSIW